MTDFIATLDKYSALLGWGLSGHQEECLTLLDMAIEELVARRKDWRVVALHDCLTYIDAHSPSFSHDEEWRVDKVQFSCTGPCVESSA